MEQNNRAALITGTATIIAALIAVIGAGILQKKKDRDEVRPRVVLHVRVGDSSDVASRVEAKLRDSGYEVPDIVMVNRDKAPARSKVRYFQRPNSAGADKLIELLHSWGVVDISPQFLPGYPGNNGYEIWFASNRFAPAADYENVLNAGQNYTAPGLQLKLCRVAPDEDNPSSLALQFMATLGDDSIRYLSCTWTHNTSFQLCRQAQGAGYSVEFGNLQTGSRESAHVRIAAIDSSCRDAIDLAPRTRNGEPIGPACHWDPAPSIQNCGS